jgi:PAS domain-containing protein
VDILLNIDAHDLIRASRVPGVRALSREAALSQWFLLNNKGPLADPRVRLALNHAINRPLLCDITEHGQARPQRAIITPEQHGHSDVPPWRYSPDKARRLLAEAGWPDGFTLRGLVSETSTSLYFAVREFLSRVGVHLEADIVPRSEWFRRIVVSRDERDPNLLFAVSNVDNPSMHGLFHHFIFLFSHGTTGFTEDPTYDQLFLTAATATDLAAHQEAMAALDRYAYDNASLLFTIQQQVHAACKDTFSLTLPRSGHIELPVFLSLHGQRPHQTVEVTAIRAPDPDIQRLVEGTSHAGAFYLPQDDFDHPAIERVWRNITAAEERWHLQSEPMVRLLVQQAESRNNLHSVLRATERVAITAYNPEGRRLYVNAGYHNLVCADDDTSLFDLLARATCPPWDALQREVLANGVWTGPVTLPADALPPGAQAHLYLSITLIQDEDGAHGGYNFVFSDFSGEEERIRNQAIRVILDNVPYGLFVCDRHGVVQDGDSVACARLFPHTADGVAGQPLTALLGLSPRDADHFCACYEQIFDDLLPEAVSLGQLPARIQTHGRALSLSGSLIRDDQGQIQSVLFTLLDISDLIEAEREAEAARGQLQVLRFRDRFQSFLDTLQKETKSLQSTRDRSSAAWQALARRTLHTAKGVFAQFGLSPLSRHIHDLEERDPITLSEVDEMMSAVEGHLRANHAIWGLQLGQQEEQVTVAASHLDALLAGLASAASLDEARAWAAAQIDAMRQKTARELLGPMEGACQQLAQRLGKRLRWEVEGDHLRWPAALAPIFDELPHLLRNAIDHGLEPPDERGDKPQDGLLRLRFERHADTWTLRVQDDGRGIDADALARKAAARGLLTPDEAAALPPHARLQLLFEDGLSTAAEVTETSGRGVGMAAVRRAVERLHGAIHIDSEPGHGATFLLAFPTQPPARPAPPAWPHPPLG